MSEGRSLGAGRFHLEALLGKGGMAEVHKALDTRFGVHRALKVLNADLVSNKSFRERFENEAYASMHLQHPNILTVLDVVQDGNIVFLVMELADGGSLADRVKQRGAMSPAEAADVALTILPALTVAHEARIVHRDIKPENMLLDRYGTLKLSDFGIARVLDRSPTLTRTGAVMGTWAYMAPEQREDAKAVDGRSDLYSLGCTLYFLVAGREPYELHNTESHERAFDGIPDAFAEIVKKATRYRQDDRYANASEMADAIRAIRGELSTQPLSLVFAAPTMYDEGAEEVERYLPPAVGEGPPVTTTTLAPRETLQVESEVEEFVSSRPSAAPWVALLALVALAFGVWMYGQGPTSVPPPIANPVAVEPVAVEAVEPVQPAEVEPVTVQPTVVVEKPVEKPVGKSAKPALKERKTGLAVKSDLGAQVSIYVDGELKGAPPIEITELAPGVHDLLLTAKGYDDKFIALPIEANEVREYCWNFLTGTNKCTL